MNVKIGIKTADFFEMPKSVSSKHFRSLAAQEARTKFGGSGKNHDTAANRPVGSIETDAISLVFASMLKKRDTVLLLL
jgi:flagellar motor switch protein FliM